MSDKNQAAIGKTDTPSALQNLLTHLPKDSTFKHCVFVNVAVEILIAALVCYQSLVVQRRNLKLLDRSGLDRVTSCRNKEHCECKIRWIT